ncbi:MAG TPA: pilin [Candidatus Paceibacterota bacterium]|nr:pilin [Candidatus Paceibacterota bacterium]
MKKSLISTIPYALLAIGVLLPLAASAQVSLPYFGGNPPFVSCNGTTCTTCDIFETAQRLIYFGMTMILFVIAPIMITVGGIMMVIAGGSEERFSSGKKMATGAVVGILIGLGAFLIVNLAISALANGAIPGMTKSGLTISCQATTPYVAPNLPSQSQNQQEQGGTFTLPSKCTQDAAGNVTCQQCTQDAAGNVTCQ